METNQVHVDSKPGMMQVVGLVDTRDIRVTRVSNAATMAAVSPKTRPRYQTPSRSPQLPSLPATPELKSPRSLYRLSTEPERHDQWPLRPPRQPKLKRKTGSPNLAASASPIDAPTSPIVETNGVNRTIFGYRQLTHQDQSHSANIHSFASDFNRYFYQLGQAHSSAPLFNRPFPLIPAADAINHHRSQSDSSQTHLKHLSKSQASSKDSHNIDHLESRKARRATHSPLGNSILSDASTASLSRFPLPPTSANPSDPNSSESRDEPGTPTVYHFRGASFEFINPRSSLRLQNIETPAEQDPDRGGYFPISYKQLSRAKTPPLPFVAYPPSMPEMDAQDHRATPPRSLFDDLPTAYNSILKNQKPSSTMLEPSPNSSPLPSRDQPEKRSGEYFGFTDNLLETKMEPHIQRPSPAVSFRERFSQVFRPRGRDMSGSDVNESSRRESPSDLADKGDQEAVFGQSVDEDFAHSPIHPDEEGSLFHFEGMSEQHYYDDPSIIDATMTRSRSTSFQPVNDEPKNHESMRWTGTAIDDSTEDLIASYGYEFGHADRSSALPNLSKHRSMPLIQGRNSTPTTNRQADSTIGEILEQYHRQDTSAFSPNRNPRGATMSSRSEPLMADTRGQDMNAFNFELDNETKHAIGDVILDSHPDQNIRAATTRALTTPRGIGPLNPLPSDPSARLYKHESGMTRRESENSSDFSALSYGDTRHLLLLSQPSIEVGRTVSPNNFGTTNPSARFDLPRGPSPNGLQLSPTPESLRRTSPMNENDRRVSDRSYEEIVDRDIKYLSRLSGLSNFQGSVYMVGSSSSAQGRDSEKSKTAKYTSIKSRVGSRNQRKEPLEPVRASYLPVAAFQHSAVVPGILRLPTADRKAFEQIQEGEKETDSDTSSEELDLDESENEDDIDDAFDWETLPESHRTQSVRRTINDSFAQWTSYSSLNTFRNVNVHPGDSEFQHGYRIHSPAGSDGPVLVPTYEFRGGAGFPNRNALTPPAPALYNTYKHPVPLSQLHENPFTSSPPQITGTAPDKASLFDAKRDAVASPASKKNENLPLFRLRHHNLSVVPEQTGESPFAKKPSGFMNTLRKISNSANVSRALTHESSGWLSSEPGPEVSLEAEHGSPSESPRGQQLPRGARLSSGVDPALVHFLRHGEPRMASSPLSPANSFARVSHLGPKGNITGTPNGTGMREVGSSLVGSSSPAGIPDSSPPALMYTTPTTEASSSLSSPRNLAAVHTSSPLAGLEDFQHGFGDSTNAGKHRRGTSFRDALIAEGKAERQARRAVPGQRELIEMSLSPGANKPITTRPSNDRGIQNIIPAREMHRPLFQSPVTNTNTSLPKLRHRYRSPSSHTSDTRDRKCRISWICFALCAIFPFTLILYGHGVLDPGIVYWTDGNIRHFGRRQKTVAKLAGWGSAATTILTVVILFVVIRTVPNNYSR